MTKLVAAVTRATRWREQGSRGALVLDCKVVPHVTARYLDGLASCIRTGML